MTVEKRFIDAVAYARWRHDLSVRYRVERRLLPVDRDPNKDIFMAHCEGYLAGLSGSVLPSVDDIEVQRVDLEALIR